MLQNVSFHIKCFIYRVINLPSSIPGKFKDLWLYQIVQFYDGIRIEVVNECRTYTFALQRLLVSNKVLVIEND